MGDCPPSQYQCVFGKIKLQVDFCLVQVAQGAVPLAARNFELVAKAAEGLQRITVTPPQEAEIGAIITGLRKQICQS